MTSARLNLTELPRPPLRAVPTQIHLPLPATGPLPGSPVLPPKLKPKAILMVLPQRCAEKGCIFPAVRGANGHCLHHRRQELEPELYCSRQPSSAMLERGKFGPARAEDADRADGRREVDRRRLTAEREQFLGEQQ